MRLIELEPRWISSHVFVFLCPHCHSIWLTCKNLVMSNKEQYELYEKEFGEDWNKKVVPSKVDYAWLISTRDFNTMTVSASINANSSGHWHGSIVNGNIQ